MGTLSKYKEMIRTVFTKHPILANSIIYGTLYVGAEFSQQTLTRKMVTDNPKPIDYGILTRYVIMGTCGYGPVLSLWYFLFYFMVLINFDYSQNNGQPAEYDHQTITRFGIIGVTFYPPVYYYWYRWLDKNFVGTATKTVVKKLLLDQFLLTPPLLVMFFVGMSIMEGKKDIFEECKNKLVPTFKSSCMFWLPAQTINFLIVPPTFRVVYVGCCAFAWVNILCWIKRQKY